MSERLDKVKLVKGHKWERKDPLDNIGISTYALIREALAEENFDLAKDLTLYLYFWEVKFVRDANIDVVAGLPQFFMHAYGEDGFVNDYMEVMTKSSVLAPRPVEKRTTTPVDWAMDYAARMVRPHRMGKNDGFEGFTVDEYEDRFEVVWNPCYTGGRTRRGDPTSGQPPHSDWPYDYRGNQVPHLWTWGKTGLSGYCIHCCLLHEMLETEQTGGWMQQWINGVSEDDWRPCKYIAYKDVDWIPEAYYERIGKKKPPVTSGKPAPPNPKYMRTITNEELGERFINTGKRLVDAIDAKDKDKALELLDYYNAETGQWHSSYPIRWNWTWIDKIAKTYGYSELYRALRSIPSPIYPPLAPDEPKPTKEELPSAEERVRKAALWGRSDRSGPDGSSVTIIDEPDRIVVELSPCGSCGRALMNIDGFDELTKKVMADLKTDLYQAPTTSLTREPYNFGTTSEAANIAWNKVGIPNFCARCCAHFELASVARSGYLETVIERPENDSDPNCRWLFYKDLDDIPEECYARIGARKPPRVNAGRNLGQNRRLKTGPL